MTRLKDTLLSQTTDIVLSCWLPCRVNILLLLDNNFIKFLEKQTDIFLEFNDQDDVDVWNGYKAFMRGIIISYTSQNKQRTCC